MMTSGPELLQMAMSESVALLQLGSVLIPMVLVTTGGCRNNACWNSRALQNQLCSSLVLGQLAMLLTGHCNRKIGPIPHGRACHCT